MRDAGESHEGVWVRPARPDDRDALLALALRLAEGLPPWREPDSWAAAAQGWVRAWAARDPAAAADQAVFVAMDAGGSCAGFVDVAARRHFTGGDEAYVGELVVAAAHEGKGVGAQLMGAAERWAHERGLRLIGLDVSAPNARARRLYQRLGYAEESVRLVKVLRSEATAGA